MPDDLGDIASVLAPDMDAGSIAYARGAWLWGNAAAGNSFSQTYESMKGTPIGLRKDQLLSMWQDIQTTQGEAASATAISYDQLASGALAEAAPANWTGQYAYRVTFTSRTKDSYDNYQLESMDKYFITSSVLTPEQAYNAATAMISLPAGVGTPDGIEPSDVVMGNLSGAWYRTQPGILGSV
jgi:hypothetical protein